MVPLHDRLAAQKQLELGPVREWLHRDEVTAVSSLERLHAGFSLLYRVEYEGFTRHLRVSALRSQVEVAASTDYLRHVHAMGAPVCAPLAWPDGRFVRRFEHDGTSYHATWVEPVPGRPIGRDSRDEVAYNAWGRAIARLHVAASSYQQDSEKPFLRWQDLLEATRSRLGPDDSMERSELHAIEAWLDDHAPTGERFGLTHADMNAGNAIWNGRDVVLIDFEEPCWHAWASDVARPLREMTDHPRALRRRLRDTLVEGYRSERALSDEEVEELDWWVRFKNLEILMWHRAALSAAADTPELIALRSAVASPLTY